MRRTKIIEPLISEENCLKSLKKSWNEINKKIKNLNKLNSSMNFDEFLAHIGYSEEEYLLRLRSSIKSTKVFLMRETNAINLNAYNKEILNLHKANMDLQFIVSPYACVNYIINYVNKSERGMSTLLRKVIDECKSSNLNLKEKFRKIANNFLNANEISAQEAAYHILSIPVSKSSRQAIYINTSTAEERVRMVKTYELLNELDSESTDIFMTELHDYYVNRPKELESLTLAEFASIFTYCKKQSQIPKNENEDEDELTSDLENVKYKLLNNMGYLSKRRFSKIIRFRKYNIKQDPDNYYREQLMLFYPWREENEITLTVLYNNYL